MKQRYGQTEKEALTLTRVCEWVADYLVGLGLQFHIDKSLVPLLGAKHLEDLLIRVQCFKIHLMYFYSQYHIFLAKT